MSDYRVIASPGAYEIGREGDQWIAACHCGGGMVVRDNDIGRAGIAAFQSTHAMCKMAG